MLDLLIENKTDNGEEGQFTSIQFDEGWTASEVEGWAEENGVDLDECTVTLISHNWSDKTKSWSLSEKEELCEKLSSFSDSWKPNKEKEEALYLYLENGHFNHTYLDGFEDAYLGKYDTEQECAMELNEPLISAVKAAGYDANFIDENYLAEEKGADSTFVASGGGVHCFLN